VEVGGEVKRGEPLVEIETDKANMTYDADTDGVLIEIVAQEGDTLEIGEVIARIGDASEAKSDGGGKAEEPAAEEGAEAEGEGEEGSAHHERCSAGSRSERDVRGQASGSVADGHSADRAGEQVGGAEARRQAARPYSCGLLPEVDARSVSGGEAGVGERQRQLREDEDGEGGSDHGPVEIRRGQARGAERRIAAAEHDHDAGAGEDEDECDREASEADRGDDAGGCERDGPSRRQRVLGERLRRVEHESPGDLQEEQPDRQLDAADQRLREGACGDVEEPEPAERDEDDAHEQGAGGDLVRA
jgi:pyruvate/2-oxoglutarate dehydrogenase complex dihydrolipoamide acyltransferase (E2) component